MIRLSYAKGTTADTLVPAVVEVHLAPLHIVVVAAPANLLAETPPENSHKPGRDSIKLPRNASRLSTHIRAAVLEWLSNVTHQRRAEAGAWIIFFAINGGRNGSEWPEQVN